MADVCRHGVVKWFDPVKKFGFVALTDPPEDALLHISQLSAEIDPASIPKNAPAVVEVAINEGKGLIVTRVISIEIKKGADCISESPDFIARGHVKWFNKAHRYGFVMCDADGADVYVHYAVMEKAGLTDLDTGQLVLVGVKSTKGRLRAVSIKLV